MKFMIAEYGPEQRAANDMIFQPPQPAGVGTFNWEPTDLWTRSGANYTAQADMSIYDQMKTDYASRL